MPAKHYRGDDHDASAPQSRKADASARRSLRRLSDAHSLNECLLIQLVGKIPSCRLIYRAISISPSVGLPARPIAQFGSIMFSRERTMGGPVAISGDQLRSIVERIEHIEEEIEELNGGKREIFQEAEERWLRC